MNFTNFLITAHAPWPQKLHKSQFGRKVSCLASLLLTFHQQMFSPKAGGLGGSVCRCCYRMVTATSRKWLPGQRVAVDTAAECVQTTSLRSSSSSEWKTHGLHSLHWLTHVFAHWLEDFRNLLLFGRMSLFIVHGLCGVLWEVNPLCHIPVCDWVEVWRRDSYTNTHNSSSVQAMKWNRPWNGPKNIFLN